MENLAHVQGMTVLAVGIIFGLGALGTAIGFGILCGRFLEGAAPTAEQDVPCIPPALPLHCRRLRLSLLCREHRGSGDGELGALRAARQVLDRAAVERARWEIHAFEAAVGRKNCIGWPFSDSRMVW